MNSLYEFDANIWRRSLNTFAVMSYLKRFSKFSFEGSSDNTGVSKHSQFNANETREEEKGEKGMKYHSFSYGAPRVWKYQVTQKYTRLKESKLT